jgi:hypothetical protein
MLLLGLLDCRRSDNTTNFFHAHRCGYVALRCPVALLPTTFPFPAASHGHGRVQAMT